MPLSPVPRPPQPSRVAAILGRRGGRDDAAGDGRRVNGPIDPERLDAQLRRARRPGLVTVPEQLRLGRVSVSTSAVVALLALVLAVGCAFVIRILWAEREAVPQALEAKPVATPTTGVTVSGGTAGAMTSAPGTAGAGSAPAPASEGGAVGVVVHVVGQVNQPGIVRLSAGARVADALTAAGGATKRADLTALNLARTVSDGEQVYVPRPGETPPPAAGEAGGGASPDGGGGTGGGPAGGAGGGGASGTGAVNLNTADLAALDSLPGVGPVLAQRILDWRAEHGRFSSVEELAEVSGIGQKLLAQLKPKVTL